MLPSLHLVPLLLTLPSLQPSTVLEGVFIACYVVVPYTWQRAAVRVPLFPAKRLFSFGVNRSGRTLPARLTPMSSETVTKASTLSEKSLSDSESVKFELVTATQWEEEWTARDTASVRLQLLGRVLCCRNKPRIRWIHSKGAILVLLWNSLVLNHYGNLGFILAGALELNSVHAAGVIYLLLTLIQSLSQMLLYPIGGWIADVYFGRYRVMKASLWLMWSGTILLSSSLCVNMLFSSNQEWMQATTKAVLLPVAVLAMEAGIAGFNANAIPFGIDQLREGSGDQLSSFVMWYVFASSIKYGVFPFPFSCPWVSSHSGNVLLQTLSQVVLLSAALILDSFCRGWFIMEPHTSNPFKLVATVLRYAWKNKQPQFRSAFTYQGHTKPSRIEFAKTSFGGPFTSEQVEDVKTFLRIVFALYSTNWWHSCTQHIHGADNHSVFPTSQLP